MSRLVAIWCALWLVACGGNVSGGSSSEADPEPEPAADEVSDPGAGPGPSGGPNADTDLGECVLGPKASEVGVECAWVTGNRCYAERAMACNCACPRGRNSQCVSGFEGGPFSRVWVSCD